MGNRRKIQQDNSELIRRNKPALVLKFDYEKFKKNLFLMANPRLAGLPDDRLVDIQKQRDLLRKQIKEMELTIDELIGIDVLNLGDNLRASLKKATEYIQRASLKTYQKSKTKKVGRPAVNGRMAIIILSALTVTKGDRIAKDKIGKFIMYNGVFHKAIDKKYGKGTYEKLNIPSVRLDDERWDSSLKKQLEMAGVKFLMDTPTIKKHEIIYKLMLNKQLKKMLNRAHYSGYTDSELEEMREFEEYCLDSLNYQS